ncbi:MAG: hypothetical protein KKB51_07460 [Candidatus Riflebacteria bacterium]|nr:hypothetical protein [Candidatus Riflebacteria bacterium]
MNELSISGELPQILILKILKLPYHKKTPDASKRQKKPQHELTTPLSMKEEDRFHSQIFREHEESRMPGDTRMF